MSDESDVRERLTRIEGKLDLIALQHSTHTAASDQASADHEARLRALERGRWPLPSLAALIALASLTLTIITIIQRGGT